MNIRCVSMIFVIVAGMAGLTLARTMYVKPPPGNPVNPYTNWADAATNIHQAVAQADNNDIILASNGTYYLTNQLSISKIVTIRSVNGPIVTIIDGNNHVGNPVTNRCIYLSAGGSPSLSGFTIQNGYAASADRHGGGILMNAGSISNCIIAGNQAYGHGGGVHMSGGSLWNCLIVNNFAFDQGGGIRIMGGAIYNCTIVANTADYGGGIGTYRGGRIYNCIVYSNKGNLDGGSIMDCLNIFNGDTNAFYFNSCSYPSNAFINATACITNNPLFVNESAGNYRLSDDSSCYNTGTNQDWMPDAYDLDGHHRLDRFSGRADMGCYEYVPIGPSNTVRYLIRRRRKNPAPRFVAGK